MLTYSARGPPCSSNPADACERIAAGSCADNVAANTPDSWGEMDRFQPGTGIAYLAQREGGGFLHSWRKSHTRIPCSGWPSELMTPRQR
jgi:hypothetical protein